MSLARGWKAHIRSRTRPSDGDGGDAFWDVIIIRGIWNWMGWDGMGVIVF